MPFYQSFNQVFVTNSPALLAQGQTVDNLAIGQIGVLDAKTYKAVTAPTYAKNKALYVVWGTPDVNLGDFGGVPNENEYTKLIKGKLITGFKAKKAQRGQTPMWTIGWSGDVSDNDTLHARVGESKQVYIKLTGTAIDRLYSKQGFTKMFSTTASCIDPCTDTCNNVNCPDLANEIAAQINADKDFSKFIRAKSIISCEPAVPVVETNCYKFALTVCDTGDDLALGLVQAQYPNDKVNRINREGAFSTYEVVRNVNTAPGDYSNDTVIIPECPTCPQGATLIEEAVVYQVQIAHGESPTVTITVDEDDITVTPTLLSSDIHHDTYTVVLPDGVTESAFISAENAIDAVVTVLGTKRNICIVNGSDISWVSNGTLKKRPKKYRITLADSICGTDRLSDLQEAYPNLVITVVDPDGDCVHTYETTVQSNCYEVGCAIEDIYWVAPEPFEGAEWVAVPAAGSVSECKCGVLIESAFVNRKTNECTFDSFPYENDVVHVQISNFNPDYNGDPCEDEWVVKQIRQVKYPQGHGQYIQKLEQESKSYDQRFRAFDPVVREVQGYSLQADPNKYYDQYVLEFDTKWKTSGGWAEDYTQSFRLMMFVPEGQGSQIEKVFNSYLTSAGIEEEGLVI